MNAHCARVGLLTNKIPGLVDFGTRLNAHLANCGTDLMHLGSSRFDVLSEGVPSCKIAYFTDYVRNNPVIPDEVFDYVRRSVSSGILWSDIDRTQAFDLNVSDFYNIPDLVPRLVAFFVDAIDRLGIGLFLYEPPSNCFALAAWHAAQMRQTPFLGMMPGRLPGRFEVISQPFDQAHAARRRWLANEVSEEGLSIADTYLAGIDGQSLEYMKTSSYNPQNAVRKYGKLQKFRHLKTEIEVARKYRGLEPSMSVPRPLHYRWAYVKRTLDRNRRIRKLKGTFVGQLPDQPFILYPIHFHPEASTSVYGVRYGDEFHTITRIASNLPLGMKLVVKDHIHAVGTQPMSFYRRLAKMPNVVLLEPTFNIKLAIRKADAMVANTSTAGFEALALGCPVFLLGEVLYSFVPWCVPVTDVEQLFEAVKSVPVRPSPEECRRFVATYADETHPGIFNFVAAEASSGLESAVSDIVMAELEAVGRGVDGALAHSSV